MLEVLGYIWVLLVVMLVPYTAVVVHYPAAGELWIRALPVVGGLITVMAGVRFAGKPIKRLLTNAHDEITRKTNGNGGTGPPPVTG